MKGIEAEDKGGAPIRLTYERRATKVIDCNQDRIAWSLESEHFPR